MNNAVRYQVMPPLSSEEYQELYESIKTEGVLEPIHVDEEGVVIDGHHRSKIASELGVPCPVITHDDLNESQKRSLAFTLNLKRRHLNREQRRALIAESLKSDPQLSNREHARRTGASPSTIQPVREHLEKVSNLDTFEKRVDPRTGNASQPVPQPSREVIATSIPQSELDELNEVEEVRPVFQAPGEPDPEPEPTPRRGPVEIDRELEAQARAKSSAPDGGHDTDSPASRNAKRFDALILARNILKDSRTLAGMLADTGGIRGMQEHLEDIATAIEAAVEANNGSGFDTELNNLLK